MKKVFMFLTIFFISVIMTFLMTFFKSTNILCENCEVVEKTIIPQTIDSYTKEPTTVYKVYDQNKLIGYLSSIDIIDDLLDKVYQDRYQEKFPNTKLVLGEGLFVTKEKKSFIPSNIDAEIENYINNLDNFSLKGYRVEFSMNDEVYASIDVASKEIFHEAFRKFLTIFISEKGLEEITTNTLTKDLTSYGTKEIDFTYLQDISVFEYTIDPHKAYTTSVDIFNYLIYGDLNTLEYYTVQPGETIDAIAQKHLITSEQLVAINSNTLKSTTQILPENAILNVTYFEPVVDVVVKKEVTVKERIYPSSTIYIEDSNIQAGSQIIQNNYREGSQNSKYEETWVNGKFATVEKISSKVELDPVTEVIIVGTKPTYQIGSGALRWPVENPSVICGWYCYPGHSAIDIINSYEVYSEIYAIDSGVVEFAGYDADNGYHVFINHNNGMKSKYSHFSEPAYVTTGQSVLKGNVIGIMGDTGYAFGVHLHLVIWVDDARVNPCNLLGC